MCDMEIKLLRSINVSEDGCGNLECDIASYKGKHANYIIRGSHGGKVNQMKA